MAGDESVSGTPRRRVLHTGGAVAAATALGSLTSPSSSAAAHEAATAARIPLARTRASGIRAAEVTLSVRGASRGAWTSRRMRTDDFALMGFSWPAHAPTPEVEVRFCAAGTWTDWRALPVLDDRPDPGAEATLSHATQPLWVGKADGVQVRVSGHRPARIVMTLIRPEEAAGDQSTVDVGPLPLARRAPRSARKKSPTVPRPKLLRRTDWSADESWRTGRPSYNDTIQQVHVHHTVSGNTYSRRETPGLLRGMYYYHTHTLGWSDIGYNFLVDRFGRIWEGRAGGPNKAVRGAHTLGFNATSCGVSVIGNLEEVQPSDATIAAIVRVAAWKLSRYGRDPHGTVKVVSEGSDKFRRNTTVQLPVIDGHRDTNDTACPGRYLYARLDDIRQDTRDTIDAVTVRTVTITSEFEITGEPTPGATLVVAGGAFQPATATATYAWLRDGVPIRRSTKAERRVSAADVGHLLSVVVTLSADGYEPASRQVDLLEPVGYTPTITLDVTGTGERVSVSVAVTADGVEDLSGTARILVDAAAQDVALVDGQATAQFLTKAGEHLVHVDYSGDGVVRPGSAEASFATPLPT